MSLGGDPVPIGLWNMSLRSMAGVATGGRGRAVDVPAFRRLSGREMETVIRGLPLFPSEVAREVQTVPVVAGVSPGRVGSIWTVP
jgi:hypothetical protein